MRDVVVVVGNELQGVLRRDFTCDFLDEFDFCAASVRLAPIRRNRLLCCGRRRWGYRFRRGQLVNAVFDGGMLMPLPMVVALPCRVEVDDGRGGPWRRREAAG